MVGKEKPASGKAAEGSLFAGAAVGPSGAAVAPLAPLAPVLAGLPPKGPPTVASPREPLQPAKFRSCKYRLL